MLAVSECIAEVTRRPLIGLTIADIGIEDTDVEERLSKWFVLAERWSAILLLAEADIFLERRTQGDIKRNGLVSGMDSRNERFKTLSR